MTRRKLTTLTVIGALAAVGVSVYLFKKDAAPDTSPAAAQEADPQRSADPSPAQIEQVPRRSQDVFIPPSSTGTGTSPPASAGTGVSPPGK